jgi:TolA-binding protein
MEDQLQDATVMNPVRGPVIHSPEPDAAPPVELARPRTYIGKYEIVALLGRGGMGAVHKGFDPLLERDVAIKVMLPGIADDPEQKQRFEREARAVARLTHPSVVTVFDLGYHTDGAPYIVMELLRGCDLLGVLRNAPPLSLDQKIAIVLQVLDGLGHAHKAGIVHRDIKPANVFIAEDGTAKIMDFGVARVASSAATGTGSVLGTPNYMSPEQVRGERVDGRSDLFSVGILLCEMLTGRRPFDGETSIATLFRIAHEEPRIELPSGAQYERLLPVLRRALARNADERYATAGEFAAALRAHLDQPAMPAPAISSRPGEAEGVAAAGPVHDASPATMPRSAPVAPPPATDKARADPSGIFRLLREIYVGEKTGHLHFAVGKERKGLRILKGRILHGTSDGAGEHLGDVLVRYGLLNQTDLERAVAIVLRERKRLGAVLSDLGLVERTELEEAVGIHTREILFSALDRPDVTFSFEETAESSLATDLVCPHSMGQVILEATRRVLDPDLVKRVLGDMSRVLTLSNDPLLRSQKITLTPADGFVLSRIDGTLSARDVVGLIPLAVEDTERSLFSLLCTGIVGYRDDGEVRRPSTRPAAGCAAPRRDPTTPATLRGTPTPTSPGSRGDSTPDSSSVVPPPAPGPGPLPSPTATKSAVDTAEIRAAVLAVSAHPRWDHFEVLGVDRTATDADIRAAYLRFARFVHPDAAAGSSLTDLGKEREAFFIRISNAYETLRNPASRAKYEQAFDAPARARRPPAQPPAPAVAATPEPAPRAPTPPPAAPAPARESTPPATDGLPDPAGEMRLAERHFKAGKFWDAIQRLEPLIPRVEGAARLQAQLLLAQAYLKHPRWSKRAETVLLALVSEAPQHCPAHLLLAEIYRGSGQVARARACYGKVLTIQPENETARQELASLEPPVEAPAPRSLLGIFKRR